MCRRVRRTGAYEASNLGTVQKETTAQVPQELYHLQNASIPPGPPSFQAPTMKETAKLAGKSYTLSLGLKTRQSGFVSICTVGVTGLTFRAVGHSLE